MKRMQCFSHRRIPGRSPNTWTLLRNQNLWNTLRSKLHLHHGGGTSQRTIDQNHRHQPVFSADQTANICHVSVSLPYTVSLHPSTHPSIIPSINHETDGLSGLPVRTDGLPQPRLYHYPSSPFYAPPPEPHITHRSIHTYRDTSTTWTGLYYLTSSSGTLSTLPEKHRSSGLSAFNAHSRRRKRENTHTRTHEMVAKCVRSESVYLRGSVHTEKPPKRAVCL